VVRIPSMKEHTIMTSGMRVLLVLAILIVPVAARGQDPPPAEPEERPTGLPGQLEWTFNFDAGWGNFGFQNSLFTNPKEDVEENLSDQWFEGYVKPALSGSYNTSDHGEFYGKVSVVGERTYGSVPAAFGEDVSSFGPEDLYIGWRSGQAIDMGENLLDFTVGRAQYRLGHGFLLYDGNAEGGSRGGYWTNARKAFEFAAVGRFKPGPHTAEVFYLDKDELPENDSGSRLWGVNYELAIGELTTLGATYMGVMADEAFRPERDGLDIFNVRAYTSPLPGVPDLSFEFEYALEDNGLALDSDAWTLQAAYQLSNVVWKPKLSYRYAFFEGDDPTTSRNEAFDPLFLGFYDWGQWWQGEIGGEYFLSNSNLISHMVRAHVTPIDAIGTGLLFFQFTLDEPASFAEGVTDDDVAFEIDWYMDWKINQNFTASLIAAYADPGTAVQQGFDRTKNFTYGMIYLAYSY
jgi:hypothetical protein